jgi:sugar-specific transcriptional regulator TrmB
MVSMVEDERFQVLTDLGLTLLQAKIYLALLRNGKATIKTIHKTANVARQDVYRIMPTLNKLGLAEELVVKPTMFKATPLKEGYKLLLHKKTHQYSELQKKTRKLINNLVETTEKTESQEDDSKFVITLSKDLLFKKFDERERTVQTSIDIICTWKRAKLTLFNHFQNYKRLLKRGVRVRWITEKHEEDHSMQEILDTLTIGPLFRIRYVSAPMPIKALIYDRKEVHMCIALLPSDDVPSLWSDNPQFVRVITTYFEDLWNKTLDV